VKFTLKYPDAKPEQGLDQPAPRGAPDSCIAVTSEPVQCAQCGDPTPWIDLCWCSFLCSDECLAAANDEYARRCLAIAPNSE
jgi:hypothetical protein